MNKKPFKKIISKAATFRKEKPSRSSHNTNTLSQFLYMFNGDSNQNDTTITAHNDTTQLNDTISASQGDTTIIANNGCSNGNHGASNYLNDTTYSVNDTTIMGR